MKTEKKRLLLLGFFITALTGFGVCAKRIESGKKSACLSEELERDFFLAVRACSVKTAEYFELHCDPLEEVKVQVYLCSNLHKNTKMCSSS